MGEERQNAESHLQFKTGLIYSVVVVGHTRNPLRFINLINWRTGSGRGGYESGPRRDILADAI